MPAGPAQSRAYTSLFSTWFTKGEEYREATFQWLASVPDENTRRQAIETVQWSWARGEPDAVRDFIAGPHGRLASDSMLHQVARRETSKNPEAAMQWAAALPAERVANARSAVLQNWLQVRPEGAMEYARKMPAGPEREKALLIVTETVIFQNPQQAGTWLRQLSGADQQFVREFIETSRIPEAHRRVVEEALKGS